jgi:hypothetical protein
LNDIPFLLLFAYRGGVILNFNEFLISLKEAHDHYNVFEKTEEKLIKEEVKYLKKMMNRLFPFASKKEVNGSEALLIYVFSTQKEWISTEAYLTHDGYVVYQVYDEEKYRGYVREANIRGGFVYMPVEKFLVHVPLKEIFTFFMERPDFLIEYAGEKNEKNKDREDFLNKIKNIL